MEINNYYWLNQKHHSKRVKPIKKSSNSFFDDYDEDKSASFDSAFKDALKEHFDDV